jgi:hypothetical protein
MFDSIFKFAGSTPKEYKPLLFFFVITLPVNYSVLYAIFDDFAGYGFINCVIFTLAFCIIEMFVCIIMRVTSLAQDDNPEFCLPLVYCMIVSGAAIFFFTAYMSIHEMNLVSVTEETVLQLNIATYGFCFAASLVIFGWTTKNNTNQKRKTEEKNNNSAD